MSLNWGVFTIRQYLLAGSKFSINLVIISIAAFLPDSSCFSYFSVSVKFSLDAIAINLAQKSKFLLWVNLYS